MACYAEAVRKGKAPDPNQATLLAPVKNDSTRTSFRWGDHGLTAGSAEGQERKREALTAHNQRRRATLLWLRNELRSLYIQRAAGNHGLDWLREPYVTADDAEMLLRGSPEKDPGGAGAWKGSIFRGADWKFTGKLVPSVIAENNGRGQRAWRYVGP